MRTLFLFATLACAGCIAPPLATSATSNPSIQVDLLFEHDGCRVYRFIDGGYHYFARCEGAGQAATVLPDRCGKSGRECGSVPAY
ncbi:MAG TPA: DUF4884 domain-containing protein [Polyangiaceae bacterium]|jgi:hypothetical protein